MGITSRMNIACLFLPAAGALWEALQPCFPFRERYLPCISICAAAAIAGSGPFRPFVKSQRGWTYAKLQCWGVSVFWQKLVYWQRPRTAQESITCISFFPLPIFPTKRKGPPPSPASALTVQKLVTTAIFVFSSYLSFLFLSRTFLRLFLYF